MFERYSEKSRRVLFFARDEAAMQAAVFALPAERCDAAWRVVAALGQQKVRIEVTSPEDTFTVSFDTMAPAE